MQSRTHTVPILNCWPFRFSRYKLLFLAVAAFIKAKRLISTNREKHGSRKGNLIYTDMPAKTKPVLLLAYHTRNVISFGAIFSGDEDLLWIKCGNQLVLMQLGKVICYYFKKYSL